MTAERETKSPVPGLDGLLELWKTILQPLGAGGPVELATRLLDPRNWLGVGGAAMEQPFETVLGLPRLADVPDLDRKYLNLAQSWIGVAQRGPEYGAMVSKVWMAAYGDFLPALQAAAIAGKPAVSGRDLLDRWTATVNERMLKAQRSAEFLEVQRRLLDALLKSRAAEHELLEIGAKAADLPTRAEMDDVHKTLHVVKRELRALQRRLAAPEEVTGKSERERGPA
jgi:class III poly(R)-hydroxyalkanoic acid synthase PhaE subunit